MYSGIYSACRSCGICFGRPVVLWLCRDASERVFPDAQMEVFPTFNSLQLLAHKLRLPYSDMICVSLTGRSWKNLDVALMRNQQTIGVLTDRKKGPSEIAERMLYYGYGNYMS